MLVPAVSLAASAPALGGLTGRYVKDGGELLVLEGDNETRVRYTAVFPQGESAGTCECPLRVTKKSGSRWALQGDDASDALTLSIEPTRLLLQGQLLSCCGMGWPGTDTFDRSGARPPVTCGLKVPRASFFDSEEATTPRKTYVVDGDTVEVLLPGSEPRRVPARFRGSSKSTVGLLERNQLECPKEETRPPVAASRLQRFAGTWFALTPKGKGFVIFKPCAARPRGFTVRPDRGELEVELGQEKTLTKVTGLKVETAAVSASLELTYESGDTELVTWKDVDVARGLASLSSADLFSRERVYVREDQRSAFPFEEEPGCEKER